MSALACAGLLAGVGLPLAGSGHEHRTAVPVPAAAGDLAAKRAEALGSLPVHFEPGPEGSGGFVARAAGLTASLAPTEAHFAMRAGKDAAPVQASLRLVGANGGAAMAGRSAQVGKVNYFRGNDPAAWRTDVPTFGRVVSTGVYPGVDLAWHGAGKSGALEYDFVVAPGADPSPIAVSVGGAESLAIDQAGDLVARLAGGASFRQRRPVAYQQRGGRRMAVEAAFVLKGDRVRFHLGDYDASRTLVIDPVLAWSTYLGGAWQDLGHSIGLDANRNVYVAGTTRSSAADDFPVTANALDGACGVDGTCTVGAPVARFTDAFVAKLSPTGALLYATYIGGSFQETSNGNDGLSVSAKGTVFLTGATTSPDFPRVNSLRPCPTQQSVDAFLLKLNAAGNALKYSTCLGGGSNDEGWGSAVDGVGNAYVVGYTDSANFPTFNSAAMGTGGLCLAHSGDPDVSELRDAFVAKVGPDGSLVYSTCWGGLALDEASAVDVDVDGFAYVVGYTDSKSFPEKNNDGVQTGKGDSPFTAGFVLKVSPTPAPEFSTLLGGNGADALFAVAVKSTSVYVAGATASTDHPIKWPQATAGAYQPTRTEGPELAPGERFPTYDALVARLRFPTHPHRPVLDRLTHLGGSYDEYIEGIVVHGGGVWVSGGTQSASDEAQNVAFPTVGALQPSCAVDHPPPNPYRGNSLAEELNVPDAFVARLDKTLSTLSFSTCLGGSGEDKGTDLAVDAGGNVFVTGFTLSPSRDDPGTTTAVETPFPTTAGAFDRICGSNDVAADDLGLCKYVDHEGTTRRSWDAFVAKIKP